MTIECYIRANYALYALVFLSFFLLLLLFDCVDYADIDTLVTMIKKNIGRFPWRQKELFSTVTCAAEVVCLSL